MSHFSNHFFFVKIYLFIIHSARYNIFHLHEVGRKKPAKILAKIQLFYNCSNRTVHYNLNTAISLGRVMQNMYSEKFLKISIKPLRTSFPVMLQTFFLVKHSKCTRALKDYSRGTKRALEEHSPSSL